MEEPAINLYVRVAERLEQEVIGTDKESVAAVTTGAAQLILLNLSVPHLKPPAQQLPLDARDVGGGWPENGEQRGRRPVRATRSTRTRSPLVVYPLCSL